jgi:hypothetical protein
MGWKGGTTYTPVTRAPSDCASFTPARMPLPASFEPSVGIALCLKIDQTLRRKAVPCLI